MHAVVSYLSDDGFACPLGCCLRRRFFANMAITALTVATLVMDRPYTMPEMSVDILLNPLSVLSERTLQTEHCTRCSVCIEYSISA